MAERYRKSGKSKFILLIISDLDPAGMGIAESFAQSLRDDFAVENIHAIKVGITPEQVKQFGIPHGEKAKIGRGDKDGLRREFVRRYSEYVYEVEALPNGELENLLDNAVRSVLDLDAFNHEVEQEHIDARQIEATRAAARSTFKDLDLDDEEVESDE